MSMTDLIITPENAITLCEAAKLIPGRPSIPTVWRWCRHGLKGVRLQYVRCGRKIFTSRDAIVRFTSDLAAADNLAPATPTRGFDGPRRAMERCNRAGW